MGGSEAVRRTGHYLLAALLFVAAMSLRAEPDKSSDVVDAAKAASAVEPASAAVGDVAAPPVRSASAVSGHCPTVDAPYCQSVRPFWLFVVLGFYAVAFAAARWHLVARPNLYNLEGQAGALRQWVMANPKSASSAGPDDAQVDALLTRVEELAQPDKYSLLDKLLWGRSKDLVGWQMFYQAWELLLVRRSPEELRCFLEASAHALSTGDAEAIELAQRIKVELQREPLDARDGARAVLQELGIFLSRFDSALDRDIDNVIEASKGSAPPTAAAAIELVKRVSVALCPPASLSQHLAAGPWRLPLWQQVGEHALRVAIPAAIARQEELNALTAAGAVPSVDACLVALERSGNERRALQALAARLHAALEAAPLATSERRLALAHEALALAHYGNISAYDKLFTWHRKNLWLGMTTLVLVLLLALAVGNPLLFLMGAFGGLISRLRLAVTSGGLGESQDLHWTTLFLSPLMGALAAWGGTMLIALGVHLGVLGSSFDMLAWNAPLSPTLLGVALLLGFAERLFLDVASRLQKAVPPADVAPSATTPANAPLASAEK